MNFENHKFYNTKVTLDNGEEWNLNADWIHNHKFDNWFGYKCHAGVDRISIDYNNDVYSGMCNNDLLGNLDTDWQLLNHPTMCKFDYCTGCTDDLIVKKYKDD